MIKNTFPNAFICNDFEPTGISNVIQAADDGEILYIRARTKSQLDSLINKNLKESFYGLIVSPFKPEKKNLNYCLLSLDEMQLSESRLIEEFYPVGDLETKFIGITGTNGKTSSCWYCMEVAKLVNIRVLYMGTIGVFIAGQKKEDKILTTTPSLLTLRKLQHKYAKDIDIIALEVSSHALEQGRLNGIRFDVVGWTNFSQDHLDFHTDMTSYFNAKLRIFSYSSASELIVSREEKDLISKLKKEVEVEGTKRLDSMCSNIPASLSEGFARANIEMALSCLQKLGKITESVNLSAVSSPPGRFELVDKPMALFVIDYAHTPDALEKVLSQTNKLFPNSNIITVFGCGGDRDKSKRPLMYLAARKLSGSVIVTSDNPRTEQPQDIIDDIIGEYTDSLYEVDRKKAIEKAYEMAKSSSNDKKNIVVIAGKGDESYQEIHGIRYAFSDAAVIQEL